MRRHTSSGIQGGIFVWVIVGIVLFVGVVAVVWRARQQHSLGMEDRQKAYAGALEIRAQEAESWPQTPQALIEVFWKAASEKDYERLILLSPGSVAGDFQRYYDQWTPSAARSIGPAEPVKNVPGVNLYPVKVDFPGFPGKTIKMAVGKLEDGRLAIDSRRTIWW